MQSKLFVVIAYFIVVFIECQRLKMCSKWKANTPLHDGWFLLAQLYSFCPECVKGVCQQSFTFNITACEEVCENAGSCVKGCQYFDQITKKRDQGVTQLDPLDKPDKLVNLSREFYSYVNSSWHWNSKNVRTVYLVTITVQTVKRKSMLEEVLGLTFENQIMISEADVCPNLPLFVSPYGEGIQFQLKVYPINQNGYDLRSMSSSEFTTFRKGAGVTSIVVEDPKVLKTFLAWSQEDVNLEFQVTWKMPIDLSAVPYTRKIIMHTRIVNCSNVDAYDKISQLNLPSDRILDVNETGAFYLLNNLNDDLKSCLILIKVSALVGECILANLTSIFYRFKGCHTVPTYEQKKCQLQPTSEPADVFIIDKALNISAMFCVDNNAICSWFYNITLMWTPPNTTVQRYQLRFGEAKEMFTKNNFVVLDDFAKTVFLPPNSTSYQMNVIPAGMVFGIYVFAETLANSDFFRPLKGSNYLIVELKAYGNESHLVNPSDIPPKADGFPVVLVVVIVSVLIITGVLITVVCFFKKTRMQKKSSPWNMDLKSMGNYFDTSTYKRDGWEISLSMIKLVEQIGKGAFGTVYSAFIDSLSLSRTKYAENEGGVALIPSQNEIMVAVKLLNDSSNDTETKDFYEEIQLMKRLTYHKHIVNLIGCSIAMKPMCLIVEYMCNGDLLNFLRKKRVKLFEESTWKTASTHTDVSYENEIDNSETIDARTLDDAITPEQLLSFAWQISSGMEHLSSISFVHRDLAARNILVGADLNAKIADFGLSRQVEQVYVGRKHRRLPVKWMSLESILDHVFTLCSDVWSYGVVLFEIATLGGTPYPGIDNKELITMLANGYRMPKPPNCSEHMYDMMMHCWCEDSRRRPTFSELREHLESAISDNCRYISFDGLSDKQTYYNVPSFNSLSNSFLEERDASAEVLPSPMLDTDNVSHSNYVNVTLHVE